MPATAEVGRREERDGTRGAGTEARPGKGTGMEDLRGLQAWECVLRQDREKMLGLMGKEPGIWRKKKPESWKLGLPGKMLGTGAQRQSWMTGN